MIIDLRSDTVTKPSSEMRRVMAHAEVGDDVFGEDPTARDLESLVADLLGKEAGLFVPSGVMGNQIALKLHTAPGDEVILDAESHIFNYESGAPGLLSGVQLRTLRGKNGIPTESQIRDAIRPDYYWEPRSRLLCLENTVNKTGGVIVSVERSRGLAETARSGGMAVHLDGARIWNAAVATGIPESDFVAPFDTVSVCFSKGLGAPVGSMLLGTRSAISEARRYRKLFGGGMRQIGILAAAAKYAVEHHRDDLAEDHRKARILAETVAGIPAFSIEIERVQTNIVMFDVVSGNAQTALSMLAEHGVRMIPFGPVTIRATTHRDVSMPDIERAVDIIHRVFARKVRV